MRSLTSLFEASTQAPIDKIDYQVRNDGIKQVDVKLVLDARFADVESSVKYSLDSDAFDAVFILN